MNKALFLDRDGVINVDKGYIYKIEDFEFIEGVFEVLKFFQDEGYLLIIITNQAGIGRGYYSEEDFHRLNDWMVQQFEAKGIRIAKIYYAPSHPEFGVGKYKCDDGMRKPNPGMILRAKDEFDIDLGQSILIGDKESDIEAGVRAGVEYNILIRTDAERRSTQANYILNNVIQSIHLFYMVFKKNIKFLWIDPNRL